MWDKPRLLNWIANFLFALAVVLMLYAVLFVVVHLPIFPIHEVKVDGQLTHVNREQIKLIVAKHLKGNFFTLDLIKTRDAFEKLPWARNVSVRRRWPDKLDVAIEEHQALARWGNIGLVNTHGELFQAATDADLPVFYGPGDGVMEVTKSYGSYSQILNKADIRIAQVTLSPRRAWEIKTDKGLLIALGRVDMEARLNKFAGAYKSTLGQLNVKVVYADLRYPNGFAVRKPIGLKPATGKPLPVKAIPAVPVKA
ncbi:MAG TPA: cell division protein FtsQ/DivIB [Methylotenera sp.]|nr:cell division protein FtsQ/DivIB [Methylotenera sp.]HPV45772.1 cell division protein FtsQ/DivIB [Methylotenera sp.]